jgi:hypothetical protein
VARRRGRRAPDQPELFPDLPDWEAWEVDLEIAGLGIILYSPPASGLLGDRQAIGIHLEPTNGPPPLRWEGVPLLCEAGNGS